LEKKMKNYPKNINIKQFLFRCLKPAPDFLLLKKRNKVSKKENFARRLGFYVSTLLVKSLPSLMNKQSALRASGLSKA